MELLRITRQIHITRPSSKEPRWYTNNSTGTKGLRTLDPLYTHTSLPPVTKSWRRHCFLYILEQNLWNHYFFNNFLRPNALPIANKQCQSTEKLNLTTHNLKSSTQFVAVHKHMLSQRWAIADGPARRAVSRIVCYIQTRTLSVINCTAELFGRESQVLST